MIKCLIMFTISRQSLHIDFQFQSVPIWDCLSKDLFAEGNETKDTAKYYSKVKCENRIKKVDGLKESLEIVSVARVNILAKISNSFSRVKH